VSSLERYAKNGCGGNGEGCKEADGSAIVDGKSLSVKVLLCSIFVLEDAIEITGVEDECVRLDGHCRETMESGALVRVRNG